jgi:hypothetical protein
MSAAEDDFCGRRALSAAVEPEVGQSAVLSTTPTRGESAVLRVVWRTFGQANGFALRATISRLLGGGPRVRRFQSRATSEAFVGQPKTATRYVILVSMLFGRHDTGFVLLF